MDRPTGFPGYIISLLVTLFLVSCASSHIIRSKRDTLNVNKLGFISGSDNGNFNQGSDNGLNNGNCHGNCLNNHIGNLNGNENVGDENGSDNGNCVGNCVGNLAGNGNGNANNSSRNGNRNGNCVGNCFHNIMGNSLGNHNKLGGKGNNHGNCRGNCFHKKIGNFLDNDLESYDLSDKSVIDKDRLSDIVSDVSTKHTDTLQNNHYRLEPDGTNCFGNCFGVQPTHRTPQYTSSFDVKTSKLQCDAEDGFRYYVTPGSYCLEVHRIYTAGLWYSRAMKYPCGPGTAFDLDTCACNHWYFIDVKDTCRSYWYSWAS